MDLGRDAAAGRSALGWKRGPGSACSRRHAEPRRSTARQGAPKQVPGRDEAVPAGKDVAASSAALQLAHHRHQLGCVTGRNPAPARPQAAEPASAQMFVSENTSILGMGVCSCTARRVDTDTSASAGAPLLQDGHKLLVRDVLHVEFEEAGAEGPAPTACQGCQSTTTTCAPARQLHQSGSLGAAWQTGEKACEADLPLKSMRAGAAPAERLAASVDAGRVLRGEQHEVRVRLDGLAQLRHVQLAVVVQQPAAPGAEVERTNASMSRACRRSVRSSTRAARYRGQ